jgi:hypothetical protein
MKKSFVSLALSFLFILGYSQEEEKTDTLGWKLGGVASLNFSQVSLYQWTAGGEASFAGAALVNFYANYKGENSHWENTLDLGYGLIRQGKDDDATTKKTDDRIDFTSKYGRKINEKLFYSGLLQFRTQFTEGYEEDDTEKVISDFFAPAYLGISAGVDYKPNDALSLFLSPASGKFTFVNNDSLSAAGEFGVDPGKKFRAEIGAYARIAYRAEIFENVNLTTKMDLFSNYLNNPQNIDVNLELLLAMKINEFLSATVSVMSIYDDDINLKQSDGTMGPGIQVKEVFGLGLSYSF